MFFTRPYMLIFAVTAVPIIAFYLLRARRRRVTVATLMFWDRAVERQGEQRRFSRLQDIPSLLMQLLLAALLVITLADPWWGTQQSSGQQTTIVLDTSASMQAVEDGRTRFDRAMARARELAATARDHNRMAIVLAGTRAVIACGMTSEPAVLSDALDHVHVTDGPADIQRALNLARRLERNDAAADQIVVLTDGSDDESNALVAESADSVEIFGTSTGNVALTEFQVRRNLTALAEFEALIEISNFSEQPADIRVDVTLGARTIDSIPLSLEPDEVWLHTLAAESISDGVLTAQISQPDALTIDNIARAVLPAREAIPVTLVSPGPHYLERVLLATGIVDLNVVNEIPDLAPAGGLLIIHQTDVADIPGGNVFVIDPLSSSDLWQFVGELEFPVVGQQDADSPLMQNIDFGGLNVPAATHIVPGQSAETLVATASGPGLLMQMNHDRGRVLILTVDILQSDLPLRTVFPILIANSLNWFLPHIRDAPGAVSVTEPFPLNMLSQTGAAPENRWTLLSPDGEKNELPGAALAGFVGPLSQTGLWTVQMTAGQVGSRPEVIRRFACNVADSRESDLRITSRADAEQRIRWTSIESFSFWRGLLICLMLLFGLEWYLFHKRII